MRSRLHVAATTLALFGGCADPEPTQLVGHEDSVQRIWSQRCVSSCHQPQGEWAYLDLSAGAAYGSIVGVVGIQADPMRMPFITPSIPEESYLWHKITANHLAVGGSGVAMPKDAAGLTAGELVTIERWILDGAFP